MWVSGCPPVGGFLGGWVGWVSSIDFFWHDFLNVLTLQSPLRYYMMLSLCHVPLSVIKCTSYTKTYHNRYILDHAMCY